MTLTPERLPDGRLLVPLRGVSEDGVVAEGLCPIGPEHPAYQLWSDYLEAPLD